MQKEIVAPFGDCPDLKQIEMTVNRWRKPELPDRLKTPAVERESFSLQCAAVRKKLADVVRPRSRSQLEVLAAGWLYVFVRDNVKRGREFDLRRVLKTQAADCLGFSKLFTMLGRWCGLNAGIVEVVRDNGGRLVPHTAIMVTLSDSRLRFIDFWYGSQDVKHKRLGLQVKRAGRWQVRDVDFKELKGIEVRSLPDSYVDGITAYINGNRHLKSGEYAGAVRSYSEALKLYPDNPGFLYNRAIAYEKLGKADNTKVDYEQALHNEDAKTRLLAREHEEVSALMRLDYGIVNSKAQEIYLLHKGFTTGRKVSVRDLAMRFRMTETEVRAIIYMVEEQLGNKSRIQPGVKN